MIIDSTLYWAACDNTDEALYLEAVFNAPTVTQRLAPLQARDEHNPRHFHKLPLSLSIPFYEATNPLHKKIASLAADAESVAAALTLPAKRFEAQRRHVREALAAHGLLGQIDEAVSELLAETLSPEDDLALQSVQV